MLQPKLLQQSERLKWATGRGSDVWELFCACIAGQLAKVQELVQRDPSIVRTHYAYRTPLYFAVRENRLAVVEYLLDQGADPLSLAVEDSLLDICRDRGYTELQEFLSDRLAVQQGASPAGEQVAQTIRQRDIGALRALLDEHPELIHAGDERSNQPIHWAVMTRQLDMIDELVQRGANLNAVRFDGARPMQLANGDYHFRGWRDVPADWPVHPLDVIAHLRLRGAYCDLCTACHIGDLARVHELLQADPSLANRVSEYVTYYATAGTPLKNAAGGGHLEIVQLLLAHGADPNLPEEGIAPDGHALYSAVSRGHLAVARVLLEHGAVANPEVESSADALSIAISRKDEEMIQLLCSYGASRGVHLLAHYGDVLTAAAVFDANPALADDPGALASAAGEGHEAFVRLMLRYVPDLPQRVEFPAWSVGAKTPELNELLLAHGLNPSQPDWLMITPLHQFARQNRVAQATWFLDHGANLLARDEDICSTPLGWAAKFGSLEMVELLLERGAPRQTDDDPPWATPLAWATRRGHQAIVERLTR